jgi:hypothetical protein
MNKVTFDEELVKRMIDEAVKQERTWVGLTDEEIEVIEALKAPPVHPDFVDCDDWMDFAQAIEAKLKEKNT